MSKYIDADKLEKNGWNIHRIRQASSTEMVYEVKKPTDFTDADAAEVRRGKWIVDKFGTKCSSCGLYAYLDKFGKPWESAYCPNCGASMQKEDGARHGRWIPTLIMGDRGSSGYSCSVCNKFNKTDSSYCPNCGASMDEVEE